jgi:hypothetical protein
VITKAFQGTDGEKFVKKFRVSIRQEEYIQCSVAKSGNWLTIIDCIFQRTSGEDFEYSQYKERINV